MQQVLDRSNQFVEDLPLFGGDDCEVLNIEPSVEQIVESVERSYQMWTQWSLDLMESIAGSARCDAAELAVGADAWGFARRRCSTSNPFYGLRT